MYACDFCAIILSVQTTMLMLTTCSLILWICVHTKSRLFFVCFVHNFVGFNAYKFMIILCFLHRRSIAFTLNFTCSFLPRLDVYIYDYLIKRKLSTTAEAFVKETEAKSFLTDLQSNCFHDPRLKMLCPQSNCCAF